MNVQVDGLAVRARLASNLAVVRDRSSLVDVLVAAYLALLTLAAFVGSGPLRTRCLAISATMLAVFVGTVCFVRGVGVDRKAAAYAYRAVILASVLSSYFLLRWLLPTARTAAYDLELLQIDRLVFGFEPTQWLERWITPARTEWFAAFYLSYFALLALHVLPMLFLCRDDRLLSEFALGVIGLVCVGNLSYFVVPGFGPHHHLAYATPLPPGTVHNFLQESVANAGALKDIFPSLHTALPTLLALFTFRHRRLAPFGFVWPVVTFFAVNIIIATLFLRWHYGIDVVAGLALAWTVSRVAPVLAAREDASRRARGLGPDWPPIE